MTTAGIEAAAPHYHQFLIILATLHRCNRGTRNHMLQLFSLLRMGRSGRSAGTVWGSTYRTDESESVRIYAISAHPDHVEVGQNKSASKNSGQHTLYQDK